MQFVHGSYVLGAATAMKDEKDRLAILGDVDLAGDELLVAEYGSVSVYK
jgi:hypothetical protein